MKDTEIIEAVRSGNAEKAIKKMYSQLSVFRRYVKTCGGSREDADDLFQETLLVFCKKISLPDFQLSASLSTYLLAIAKYKLKDEMRKKSKTINVPLDESSNEFSSEMDETNTDSEKTVPALNALKDLGDRCLELLENFYFRKMSMKDISVKMKFSSEKIAKNQKYKCLERARTKLKECEVKMIS